MKVKIAITLLLILFPVWSWATCSGSGLTWTCTAGSTGAQINTAISSATNGATITLANGAYSFTGVNLSTRNGISIVCASVRGCTNSASGGIFLMDTAASTHTTGLMRISGFNFTGTSGLTISIGYTAADAWIDQFRIDHNTFNSTDCIAVGHTQASTPVYGVIDNNIFQGATHNYPISMLSDGNVGWDVDTIGTVRNIFVEDNVFNYTSENLGASGMDMWSRSMVVRHNTITNARTSVHGVCHGGPANLEIYNNTYVGGTGSSDGYRIIHHQGSGTFMVFNNNLTPTSASMSLQYYRSSITNPEGCGTCDGNQSEDGNRSPTATYRGYPCFKQPGRNWNEVLTPVYMWNNTFASTGNEVYMSVEAAGDPSYLANHMIANRDYYEAVSKNAQTSATSPFNGTTGMGFGTLANRPTTCTTGTEALDAGNGGVGYFATDVGTQGTLYMCSSTNTWTSHYTPYTYPHPLQGAAAALPSSFGGVTIQGGTVK